VLAVEEGVLLGGVLRDGVLHRLPLPLAGQHLGRLARLLRQDEEGHQGGDDDGEEREQPAADADQPEQTEDDGEHREAEQRVAHDGHASSLVPALGVPPAGGPAASGWGPARGRHRLEGICDTSPLSCCWRWSSTRWWTACAPTTRTCLWACPRPSG